MRHSCRTVAVVVLAGFMGPAVPLTSAPAARAQSGPAELRERVLQADTKEKAAAAYKAYFLQLGRAGLRDLLKDEDTGIALQAAWECHLKPVKREPKVPARTDDVYDPAELKKFVAFLRDRTKAPVPDWWTARLADMGVGRQAQSFGSDAEAARPKRRGSKAGPPVPDGAELEASGDALVYTTDGRSVTFDRPKPKFGFGDRVAGYVGKDRSAVAVFSMVGGRYRLSGYAGADRRPAWAADVWGSGRTGPVSGFHDHWAEVVSRGEAVYVFGAESHGMYLEAFDLATGKVRFRFCTCYWWHWSEAWGLK